MGKKPEKNDSSNDAQLPHHGGRTFLLLVAFSSVLSLSLSLASALPTLRMCQLSGMSIFFLLASQIEEAHTHTRIHTYIKRWIKRLTETEEEEKKERCNHQIVLFCSMNISCITNRII